MAQLDALQLTDALRSRMVDFAADDNFVRDERLADIARRIWNGPPAQGGLISDLWVEGAFPSKTSLESLNDLVGDGRFDRRLSDVLHKSSAVPGDRPLYTHQLAAIERAQSGVPGQQPAMVVTAGTGAGKTEAFLLPILNDLYCNPPTQRSGGARCIILYPMNALVNDQVERLYGWLQGQQDVTLFHFTSETPEDSRVANDQGVPEWTPCRMRTRQQARGLESRSGRPIDGGPTPDIVITNYSMLEYMLCRPQDAVFFGPDLRAIVLDEAHLYTGTLAAEITLLLRRLLLRCGLKPEDVMHFATSATLGTGEKSELEKFAAQVFSKPTQLVHVIAGEPTRTCLEKPSPPESLATAAAINSRKWLDGPTIVDSYGQAEFAVSDAGDGLKEDLATVVSRERVEELSPTENRPAVLLHHGLAAAPLVHQMHEILWDRKQIPLTELAKEVFGDASELSLQATVRLLQLTASARAEPTEYPLIPHRIHVMSRPTDCLTICLNDRCNGEDDAKLPPLGVVSAGYHDTCEFCRSRTLSLERCGNCGQWLLAGRDQDDTIVAALPRVRREEDSDTPPQRRLFHPTETSDSIVYVDVATGDIRGSGAAGIVRLYEHQGCPNCRVGSSQVGSFYSGVPLTLSVLAETLLAQLPEFPAQASGSDWLPARGRRLLTFSDSRREAARLGPLLTSQHEQQLVRAAIVAALDNSGTDAVAADVQEELERVEARLLCPNLDAGQRRRLERQRDELQTERAQFEVGGAVSWLAGEIGNSEMLSQIIDRQGAANHSAGEWRQQEWEENQSRVVKRTNEFLGRELASPIRRSAFTLESAGLVEVTYPGLDKMRAPANFIGVLPTEGLRRSLSDHWTDLLAALCDTLRTDGVVTLGQGLDESYAFGGMLIGRWSAAVDDHSGRGQNGLERFVGATKRQRRRQFAMSVLRSCGMPEEQVFECSEQLLHACFDQLLDSAKGGRLPWLEFDRRQARGQQAVDAIRIRFFELGLRRPATLFQCHVTGHVWPRSVAGCAPESGCEGTLEAVAPDTLDEDPRLGRRRREYHDSPIFRMGLWAEEHSAQLDPKENRRLQDLFKSGVRNVLSSTTTLELGIDIGGLNGVLMSNVPPGKANYLQRAGRAGRRADGSSIVAAFARPRPYDREVFQRIGDYLDTPLRRPVVFLDRERVVRRHAHAFMLGEFFKQMYGPGQRTGAMDAFGRMGSFCAVAETSRWQRGSSKPTIGGTSGDPSLREQFRSYVAGCKQQDNDVVGRVDALLEGTAIDFGSIVWSEFLDDVVEAFDKACTRWQDDYDLLLAQWNQAVRSKNRRQANAIHYQLWVRRNTTVIEALADRQFLPSYGFPIGVLKLRVTRPDEDNPNRIREEDQFRLERQGLLALREYVPGSQLLVGGQLVTSHGILKHWSGVDFKGTPIGLRGQYTRCINDHIYYWWADSDDMNCPFCRAPAQRSPVDYIVPQYGFSGATWDPPKWSTATPEIVGEVETVPASFTVAAGNVARYGCLGGVQGLSASYREDGELLVYNEGERKLGFAVCLQCGYSASERTIGEGRVNPPPNFAEHFPLNASRNSAGGWRRCWRDGQAPVLRNQTFAARETTDVLLLDFGDCLSATQQSDEALVTTLGYALQRAASELLQLDGRELGVATMPTGSHSLGVLLYDNVPGGAGHVRELLEMGRQWLEWAKRVLFVNDAHDRRCHSACLDCLLSFQTQNAMQRGLLNRPQALSTLSDLL